MATTKKAAFSSNHDEGGLVDFDQILSDLCDLEHQLNEQSNLNDKFPPPPKQPSSSSVIFKDYSQLMTNSPSKAKLSTNGPCKPCDQVIPAEVGNDLDCALLELSSLIGPGFDFDRNAEPMTSVKPRTSNDLMSSTRVNRLPSNQLRKVANGADNNNVHPRSKSMENCQHPVRILPNNLVPRSDGLDRLSDGGQNDSVFEDDVSIPSSGSRVSMATSSRSSRSSIANGGAGMPSENDEGQRGHDASKTSLIKNNQTDPKKTFVQVYSPEGHCTNASITEQMKVWKVVNQLLTNNSHSGPNLSWSLVEQLPGLWMERLLEDSERLAEVVLAWTKDSENRILLAERSDKYDAFVYPEKYMTVIEDNNKKCDDGVRQVLIQEFLDSNCRLPEFDGMLYIKLEGKKAWKKLYFILRSSGIYYNPKGKNKSLIDLVCLQRLDLVEVYTGIGWKKKYKAPTDFGFALKHPQIQKKAPKYIKYLCAEDANSMWRWVNSMRLAKYGQQLHNDFVECKSHVNQFSGEDSTASRSKQTAALIQEKISEMLSSQQTDSAPSFCSAAEKTSAPQMQTFRSESPDGSRLRMSCLEENGKPPGRLFRSPVHRADFDGTVVVVERGPGVDETGSPGGIVLPPSKSPKKMAESASVHHFGPTFRAVSGDGGVVDAWKDPGFPLFHNNNNNSNNSNNHEMLSGSVDQLQSVGSTFGRQKTPTTAHVGGGRGGEGRGGGGGRGGEGRGGEGGVGGGENGSARWVNSPKHAVIKRTPSIGHRDLADVTPVHHPPRLGPPTSPKPQPLPKPSFTPGASQLRSSLPPVRRKFPSSTSFFDCDDGTKASLVPTTSPKPKPPLPPKRTDMMKQSVSADSSPCHRALPPPGELPKFRPPVQTRPSSTSSSSQQSLSPPPSSPSSSWQNSGFLVDLERVILQKRANGPDFATRASRGGEQDGVDGDLGELPPPPVTLLAGLRGSNRPPLPPKRSNETKLSHK